MLTGKDLGAAIAAAIDLKISSGAISSKVEVAKAFGVKPPSIHDWINKGTISKNKLPLLWEYFSDVVGPQHWGIDQRTAEHASAIAVTAPSSYEESIPAGYVRLQHLSPTPSMGMGAVLDEPVRVVRHLDVLESWLMEEVGSSNYTKVKVLTAVGRSMMPTINDKDLVFVDVTHRMVDAPGIYVIDVAGRLLLKKAMIKANGTLVLRSDNAAEYPDEETYDLGTYADEITVCGKVLAWWALRKG